MFLLYENLTFDDSETKLFSSSSLSSHTIIKNNKKRIKCISLIFLTVGSLFLPLSNFPSRLNIYNKYLQ